MRAEYTIGIDFTPNRCDMTEVVSLKKRITAIQYNTYRGFPIDRVVEDVKKAGFDGIELSLDDGWASADGMDAEQAARIRKKLHGDGLQIVGLGAHTDLFAQNATERLSYAISMAEILQTEYVVTFLGTPPEGMSETQADAAIAALLRPFIPELEKKGIKLALEIHSEYCCGKAVLRVVDLIDSPNIVINYDTANAIFYGNTDVENDFAACLTKIGYVHLKDKAGVNQEWNFPPIGLGKVPIPQILQMLEYSGNDAPLAIEIEYTPEGISSFKDAQQAARISAAYLRQLGVMAGEYLT